MNITLEQSLASAVRFILDNDTNGARPYFEDVPEEFYVPSVYFPVPYVEGAKVTLDSYRNTITFEARIMAATDWDAEARAASLRDLLMLENLHIPIYGLDGKATGKSLRVLEPYQRRIERGIVLLSFSILDYFTPTPNTAKTKANNIYLAWNGVMEYYTQEVNNGE